MNTQNDLISAISTSNNDLKDEDLDDLRSQRKEANLEHYLGPLSGLPAHKYKNLLHGSLRIQRFSIPHSTGQAQLSKAGTVLAANVREYLLKVKVRNYDIELFNLYGHRIDTDASPDISCSIRESV